MLPILAADAPSGAVTWLLTQGVLGVVCALLIASLVYAVRELKAALTELGKVRDDRIADQKEMATALERTNGNVSELAREVAQNTIRSNDAVKYAMDAQRQAFSEQERSNEKVSEAVKKVESELIRLSAKIDVGRG